MLFATGFILLSGVRTAFAQRLSSNEARLFIQNQDPNAGWAASIQNACNGSTTYVISCTFAPLNNQCSPQTATITEGSDFYIATTPAIYSETSATITQSCALNPTARSASCVAEVAAGMYGNDIHSTVSYNLTGGEYFQYDVKITKGAERTEGSGSCVRTNGGQSKNHGCRVVGVAITVMMGGLGVVLWL